jgi:hypothetical protein
MKCNLNVNDQYLMGWMKWMNVWKKGWIPFFSRTFSSETLLKYFMRLPFVRSFLHFLKWGIIEVFCGGQVASEHTSSEFDQLPFHLWVLAYEWFLYGSDLKNSLKIIVCYKFLFFPKIFFLIFIFFVTKS